MLPNIELLVYYICYKIFFAEQKVIDVHIGNIYDLLKIIINNKKLIIILKLTNVFIIFVIWSSVF